MSKVKDLKTDPQNNLDIIELLGAIFPVDKTKYLETILRIVNNDPDLDTTIQRYVKEMASNGVSTSYLRSLTKLQAFLAGALIIEFITPDNIKAFTSFCEYNERALVEENDVSKYKTFKQVNQAVKIVEDKLAEKRYEKQIRIIYEDDTWKILRPLTHQSSLKYGASTKWCTAMTEHTDHFERYSKGILIYTINKKTGFKVATHLDLDNQDLTFWNAADKRVDSMASRLPTQILEILKNELDVNGKSNMVIAKSMINEEKKIQKDWKKEPLISDKFKGLSDKMLEGLLEPVKKGDPNQPWLVESEPGLRSGEYDNAVSAAKTKLSFMDRLKEDLNRRTPQERQSEIEGDFRNQTGEVGIDDSGLSGRPGTSGFDESGPEGVSGIAGVGGSNLSMDTIMELLSTKKKALDSIFVPDENTGNIPVLFGVDEGDTEAGLSAVVRYDENRRPIGVDSTDSYKSFLSDIKNEESIDDIIDDDEQRPYNIDPIISNDTVSWSRTSPTVAKVFSSGKEPTYIASFDPALLGDEIGKMREKTVDFDDLPEEFKNIPSKLGKSKY